MAADSQWQQMPNGGRQPIATDSQWQQRVSDSRQPMATDNLVLMGRIAKRGKIDFNVFFRRVLNYGWARHGRVDLISSATGIADADVKPLTGYRMCRFWRYTR